MSDNLGTVFAAVGLCNTFQKSALELSQLATADFHLGRAELVEVVLAAAEDLFADTIPSDKFLGNSHRVAVEKLREKRPESCSIAEWKQTSLEFLD